MPSHHFRNGDRIYASLNILRRKLNIICRGPSGPTFTLQHSFLIDLDWNLEKVPDCYTCANAKHETGDAFPVHRMCSFQ